MPVPTHYDVEHKCGHTETRDLSDVAAGRRAGTAAWWAEKPCFSCYRKAAKRTVSKELQHERAELRRAALEDQERANLPILRGSEKQISWATDERYRLLRSVYESAVQEGSMSEAEFDADVLELARRIDSAKWWIDNREATAETIHELLADPGADLTTNENPY